MSVSKKKVKKSKVFALVKVKEGDERVLGSEVEKGKCAG